MRMRQVARFFAVLTLVIATSILSWFVWTNGVAVGSAAPRAPETQGVIVVLSEGSADGSIRYGYGIELPPASVEAPVGAGSLVASVEYDSQTVEGINQYKAFNHSHLDRLLEAADDEDSLAVRVTFSQPLSQAEFRAFDDQYHMTVKSYIIWIDNADGTTTTIQGAPSETELIPAERFSYVLEDVQSRGGQGFLGWVEANASVPTGDLQDLANDPRVFLVDVSEALIQEQFTDAVMKQAGIPKEVRVQVLNGGLFEVGRPSLAWAIRNQGLMSGIASRE